METKVKNQESFNVEEYVESYIKRANIAQEVFEKSSQEEVDLAVRAIGKAVYDNGIELAELAVEDSGLGNVADKILKNKGKTKAVWNKIKNEKSRNIIEEDKETGITKISHPIGVIGAVLPVTNPTMTPAQNAMVALKGGNAIVFAPHPNGLMSGTKTVNYMRDALKELNLPEDLIQIVDKVSLDISSEVMSSADMNIATGGPGMVKAAYSSGRPSLGVGPGNIQAVADRDVEIDDYLDMVVAGRIYDNGILCTCEQTLIVPKEKLEDVIKGLQDRDGYMVAKEQMEQFRSELFPDGNQLKEAIGQSPDEIGRLTGITVQEDAKFIFVVTEKYGEDELFSKEKLMPVLNVISYDDFEEAVKIAKTNLVFEGAGHSSVIHSKNNKNIEYMGSELPISRLVVNQQGSSGLGGALNNGLNPTATLGCGSWGNNSISENLWWHNLVNISRIAHVKNVEVPTDEEIWG